MRAAGALEDSRRGVSGQQLLRGVAGPAVFSGAILGSAAGERIGRAALGLGVATVVASVVAVLGHRPIARESGGRECGRGESGGRESRGRECDKGEAATRVSSSIRVVAITCALIGCFVLAVDRGSAAQTGITTGPVVELAGSGRAVRVTGRVVADPESTRWGRRFDLRTVSIDADGRSFPANRRLAVTISNKVAAAGSGSSGDGETFQLVEAGSLIVAEGFITPIATREGRLWHRSGGLFRATSVAVVAPPPFWLGASSAARNYLESGATNGLSEAEAGLLLGLMYGDTRRLPASLEERFKIAGLSHLTAVSGENFAIVIGALALLLRQIARLAARRRLRTAILIAGAVAFIVMTRWEPSVMRAGAMALVLLLARLVGARPSFFECVSVAVAAVILVDPLLALAAGFQLSLAATLGIGLASMPLSRLVKNRLRIPRPVALAIAVALCAEIAVAPLIWWRFGTIQPYSIPANLAAVPVAGLVTVVGLVASSLTPLAPSIATLIHLVDRMCLWWLAGVADVASSIPGAQLAPPRLSAYALVAIYLCVSILVFAIRRADSKSARVS